MDCQILQMFNESLIQDMMYRYNAKTIMEMLDRISKIDLMRIFQFKPCCISYFDPVSHFKYEYIIHACLSPYTGKLFIYVPDLIRVIFLPMRAYEMELLLDNNKRCQEIMSIDLTSLWDPFKSNVSTPWEYIQFIANLGLTRLNIILRQQLLNN